MNNEFACKIDVVNSTNVFFARSYKLITRKTMRLVLKSLHYKYYTSQYQQTRVILQTLHKIITPFCILI